MGLAITANTEGKGNYVKGNSIREALKANVEGIKSLRFHIQICPRLTTWAGFEMGTETIVNPVSPESAAVYYRETYQ